MTGHENSPQTGAGLTRGTAERRAAHERLATGVLARWTRACANHPWRVIAGWIGIVVLLIVSVGAFGGQLRDEYGIPGSDTQRATDLIESEFASEQGGVLNLVFAAPEGERLDTPERRAAIEGAIARLKSPEFEPSEDRAGLENVGDPLSRTPPPTTVASATRKPSSTGSSTTMTATPSSPCRTLSGRRSSGPG
jgi:putative drug exporter of the RND superfamily